MPHRQLTKRQLDVLRMVAEGHTNKEIAKLLRISVKTVEFHKTLIMSTLAIRTSTGLTRYAIEHGIVPAGPIDHHQHHGCSTCATLIRRHQASVNLYAQKARTLHAASVDDFRTILSQAQELRLMCSDTHQDLLDHLEAEHD